MNRESNPAPPLPAPKAMRGDITHNVTWRGPCRVSQPGEYAPEQSLPEGVVGWFEWGIGWLGRIAVLPDGQPPADGMAATNPSHKEPVPNVMRFSTRRGLDARPRLALGLSVLLVAPFLTHAGNPISIDEQGRPAHWLSSAEDPITYHLDQGSLGLFDNEAAADFVAGAFAQWSTVPILDLTFARGDDLYRDLFIEEGDPNAGAEAEAQTDPLFKDQSLESFIIYDDNGMITQGLGIDRNSVLGFAGPVEIQGDRILRGWAVLNGRFIDGVPSPETTEQGMRGVMVHEFGHMLGLGHSDVNGEDLLAGAADPVHGVPPAITVETMFPFIIPSSMETPALDDISMMSIMYPKPGAAMDGTGTANGIMLSSAGTAFQGVNMTIRRDDGTSDTFFNDAVSQLSGSFPSPANSVGEWRMPGLVPGNYFVECGTVNRGGYSAPATTNSTILSSEVLSFYPGPDEFWSIGESAFDDPALRDTFAVTAGETATGANIRFNNRLVNHQSAELVPEPSGTFTPPISVSGSIDYLNGGTIVVGGDDFEKEFDMFLPQPANVRIEVTFPSGASDLDLLLLNDSGNIIRSSLTANTSEMVQFFNLPVGSYTIAISYYDFYVDDFPEAVRPVSYQMKVKLVTIEPEPLPTPTPTPSPTPSPSPSPQNSPTPSPSPIPVVPYQFDFPADSQGWTFISAPVFTQPVPDATGGSLGLTAADNVNTFGAWDSPILSPDESGAPRVGDYTGPARPLYRARYQFRADVAPPLVPSLRMRMNSSDFQQSTMQVFESSGSAASAPGIVAENFEVFFVSEQSQNNFTLSFDMLNFLPDNSPTGRLDVDRVDLSGSAGITDYRGEKSYLFNTGSALGWTTSGAAGIAMPNFPVASNGIQLRGRTGVAGPQIGFWTSPAEGGVTIEGGRVYEGIFRISTNATFPKRPLVPVYRVRLNDGSFQMAGVTSLTSTGDASLIAANSTIKEYRVYLSAPPELDGNPLLLSFDLVHSPELGDDPTIPITLHSVTVNSFVAK